MAASIQKLKALELAGDKTTAKREADWQAWRVEANDEQTMLLVSALGLHRDRTRGRTHIVFKLLEYVPHERQLRHRFRVVQCAVFRIADVMQDIERMLSIDPGEGREDLESVDASQSDDLVPMYELLFGEGLSTWLGGCKSFYFCAVS
jgi:hypothetical protein